MSNKGQTLVEALLATAVAITVIVALVGVGINSMRVANYSKNQAEAVKLAREQLELLRNYRDTHPWDTASASFATKASICSRGKCCFDLSVSNLGILHNDSVGCRYNNMFDISYTTESTGSPTNNVVVTVTVQFTEGSLTRTVTLTETFTNWRGT